MRFVRFDPLPDLSAESIKGWAEKALHSSTHLITEGYSSLPAASGTITQHDVVVVSPGKSSELDCFRWVNTVIGNTKNSIRGTYHGFKVARYARRYLAEVQYRFNRRFQLEDLVPRLLYACAQNEPRNQGWIRSAEYSC